MRPRMEREHGTHRGYGMHLRDHSDICEPCRLAENEYQAEKRRIRLEEGRLKRPAYQPRVPKVRVYLDAALIADFLRATDPATVKELRAELRESLDNAKDRYEGDLVKENRAERAA